MNNDFQPRRRPPVAHSKSEHPSAIDTPLAKKTFHSSMPTPKNATSGKKRLLLLAAPRKIHWWLKKLNRVQLTAVGIFLLIILVGGFLWLRNDAKQEPTVENSSVQSEPPKPTTEA